MDYYGFYTGKEFTAYEYLGAHIQENGTVFLCPQRRADICDR